MEVKKLLIGTIQFLFMGLIVLFIGCATSLKVDLVKDTNIKFIKAYQEISAGEWQKTDIMVQKGDAVIVVPLYPKGFIHSVMGKIGETGKPFEGLDVDLGDIYSAQTDGILYFGIDQKTKSVHTGIFVFKTTDFNNIISDLTYLQKNNKDIKIINLTLALLLKKQADKLLAQNKQTEALPILDQSITYLEQADAKLYSRTIYQLYREKAVIYKNSQDMANYNDNINKSFNSLIAASEYYSELSKSRFAFMKQLTPEEKFVLVMKTTLFQDIKLWASFDDLYVYNSGKGRIVGDLYIENMPVAYALICQYYTNEGNLKLSLEYGQKAVDEAKKTGDQQIISYVYRYLAERHMRFHFYGDAENAFKEAFKVSGILLINWNIFQLAVLKADIGKFDEAFETLSHFRTGINATSSIYTKMQIRATSAYIYSKKKDHKRAIEASKEVINFPYESLMGVRSEIAINQLVNVLESYAIAGDMDDATRAFKLISDGIEKRGNPPNLMLQYNLALSKFNKRFGKDEISPLQDAIASLEVIRPTAASGKDYEYWENMLKVYDQTVASLYNKEKYLEALNTVEKVRSRRFLDDLGNKKLGAKGTSSLMTQRANETLDALSMLEQDMMEAAQEAGIKVRAVYDKDSRLNKKIDNYKATLKEASDSDQQFGVVNNIVPVSSENLQKHIPADTTVVEYYQSEDNLYAWVIDNKKITAVKQELSKDKLRKLIEQYRKSLYQDTTKRGVAVVEKGTADFASLQKEAYKLLITPVEKLIKTKKLCIVPYDILNYLPFQSLQDGKHYLIEKYSLSYLPSLSVLEYLKKSQKKDSYSYKILALGNPDLNDPQMDLPAAEKEVDMIKNIFPNTAVYKRDKAVAAMVKRIAPNYDIIHFAAHGAYNPQEPLASSLYLAAGEGEDGNLEVKEIFDMNINADMVVTSSCQTAMGKIGRGDEILGFTRAFMYAGANSVLGSLWSISDEATSIFMKEFYTNIKTMEKTEALRQAQIKMIQSKEYNHPFYWAAFNITGAL